MLLHIWLVVCYRGEFCVMGLGTCGADLPLTFQVPKLVNRLRAQTLLIFPYLSGSLPQAHCSQALDGTRMVVEILVRCLETGKW
jgi:hypothetical protein